MTDKLGKFFLICFLMASLGRPALAGEKSSAYPQRPIRLIVPYVAGSGNDIQSRGIAPYVEKHLGARLVIENKPGAGGRIGMNDAWKAPPDGYTLINPGMPAPAIVEQLFSVNFRCREFTHIFAWSFDNSVLVVNSETWKTAKEFLAAARTNTLSGGHAGIGGSL
jgi:tripartite-type tricarboxylate transporter receptor subunit TctC